MDETVKNWIVSDLREHIDDLEGTLENERLWLLGCSTTEEITCHASNIKQLCEALDYYNTQLKTILEA